MAQNEVVCDGRVATIVGTPGDDEISGTDGPDVIAGLQGNDTILGRGGDDVICGGTGDDTLAGGDGFDIIFGAQGNDTIFAATGSTEAARKDSRGARIFGGKGDDVVYGSNRWDRMQGGPGEDLLLGFEGRDWMRGGPDADQVDGGEGIDDLHGGNGKDLVLVTTGDTVRGGAGRDQCDLAGEPKLLRSCGRNKIEPLVVRPPVAARPPIGCASEVNVIDRIECDTIVRNDGNSTARLTVRVAFFDTAGVRVDDSVRIEHFTEPGEELLLTFFGPPETARMTILGIESDPEPRHLSGAPLPQRFGDELDLSIQDAFVSASGFTQTVLDRRISIDLRFRNSTAMEGRLTARVAFHDASGIRIDDGVRIARDVAAGETVELEMFTDDTVVSYRVLSIELDPN